MESVRNVKSKIYTEKLHQDERVQMLEGMLRRFLANLLGN
jgi:hypothetical protein